ncbi:DUF4293 family protein [Pedobacter aquatilis]|uniref:DUF4293 family protein n=1 Tax=Pedobacter aquatilis TaxID=351343 RepID=UPI00292F1893|nr:DUF4293 family protein [Pedobacter aquatilis]
MWKWIKNISFLIATITIGSMFLFPIINQKINGIEIPILYTYGYNETWDVGEFMAIKIRPIYTLLLSNIAACIISFFNIFNYKRKILKKILSIFSITAICFLTILCIIYAVQLPQEVKKSATFGVGAYMPALAILFVFLAIFGINKDERLIGSAERLR